MDPFSSIFLMDNLYAYQGYIYLIKKNTEKKTVILWNSIAISNIVFLF